MTQKQIQNEVDVNTIDIIDLMIQDIRYQLLHEIKVSGETLQKVASEDFKDGLMLGFLNSIVEGAKIEEGSIYGKSLIKRLDEKKTMVEKLETIQFCSNLDPILQNTIAQAVLSFYITLCASLDINPDKLYITQLAILTNTNI